MSRSAAELFAHGAGNAATVDRCSLVDLCRSEPTKPSRWSCGVVGRSGEIEFEEAQRVDDLEAGGDEGGGRGGEQGTGTQRGRTLATGVGDPRFHIVSARDHVMVEQDELRDVCFIGPLTETSPDGMLGRRRVHRNEGTRTRHPENLTGPVAS